MDESKIPYALFSNSGEVHLIQVEPQKSEVLVPQMPEFLINYDNRPRETQPSFYYLLLQAHFL